MTGYHFIWQAATFSFKILISVRSRFLAHFSTQNNIKKMIFELFLSNFEPKY